MTSSRDLVLQLINHGKIEETNRVKHMGMDIIGQVVKKEKLVKLREEIVV
jgi:hypothetical protein